MYIAALPRESLPTYAGAHDAGRSTGPGPVHLESRDEITRLIEKRDLLVSVEVRARSMALGYCGC